MQAIYHRVVPYLGLIIQRRYLTLIEWAAYNTELHLLAKNYGSGARKGIWLYASYGRLDSNKADKGPRMLSLETEWKLKTSEFRVITKNLGQPEIDIFTSKANNKCKRYISWLTDPNSETIDAFTVSW